MAGIKRFGTPLSLSEIQSEFGGSAPISLSEYYSGAATGYVPSGTVGYPSGGGAVTIPSSGSISINSFYGSTKIPDSLSVRVLLVGGGGAGGQRGAGDNTNGNGGGGSGAIYDFTTTLSKGTTYTVSIGTGGTNRNYNKPAYYNGGSTSAFGKLAYGGGHGGWSDSGAGASGGSGGGGAANYGAGGDIISGQLGTGYAGASAGAGWGGGGGGAGGAGSGQDGGTGFTWIDGRVYGGGGTASGSSSTARGGGGRGADGMGNTNQYIGVFSCRYRPISDDTGSYWVRDLSWAESDVALPANSYWRYSVDGGSNWNNNGSSAYSSVYAGPWDGSNGPSIPISFNIIIQLVSSITGGQIARSDFSVSASPAPSGFNTAVCDVIQTYSHLWGTNTNGVADSNVSGGIWGNHAWYYGGGGGAGSNQGSSGPYHGGAGQNGIVVVSYQWPFQLSNSGTVTNSNGTYYHYLTNSNQTFSW